MQSDVAAAAPNIQALDDASFRPKSSLMKKLSFLLHPKKSRSKSASPSQQKPAPSLPPPPPPPTGPGSELELLFAQAEATLGELLVRAGASFEARSSSSYSHADPNHHHQPASSVSNRSQAEEGVSALIMGSSSTAGSRSANFSGHTRRRSLSRVWQQLGGSLFCGSGHMNAYMMDQDVLAPAPAPASSKGIYEDVVLDEAYWQSVADAMLLEQQQQQCHQQGAKIAADDISGEDKQSCHTSTKEVQNDQQRPSREHNAVEHFQVAEEEEEDRASEIKPSIDAESMAKLPWSSPICGSSGRRSWRDMELRNLVGAELSEGGCTRLNTTLDESPNLAHNFFVLKVGGTSSNSGRGRSEAVQAVAQPSSSSMQPLERFLWQARSGIAGPSNLMSGSASSPSSRSAPDLLTSQEPAGVDTSTTTSRVSLMALLHEEAAAGEPTATLDSRPEEEEAEAAAAALLEGEGRRSARSLRSTSMQVTAGEDPLQCCVCMSRRKGAALIPCGHTFCRICAKHLFAGRGACPLCNNLIVQVLDIF